MNPEEKAQLDILCRRIQEEKDPQKFTQLLIQLNDLLERKEIRLGLKAKIQADPNPENA